MSIPGARILFHLLRRATDLRTARSQFMSATAAAEKNSKIGLAKDKESAFGVNKIPGATNCSLTGLSSIMKKKNTNEAMTKLNAKRNWNSTKPKT